MIVQGTIQDPYVEVIGIVLDERTIKMLACINLGDEIGMSEPPCNVS